MVALAVVLLTAPPARAQKTKTFTLPGGVKLEMVGIPPGNFMMGSPETERGRTKDEGPVHKVEIKYELYLGKFEVTQQQWQAVMKTKRSKNYGIGPNHPVFYVSWDDGQELVAALDKLKLGGRFRLPSEAEWEYACRAGTRTRFYYGDSLEGNDTCDDAPAGKLPGRRTDYMWNCANNTVMGDPGFGAKQVGQKKPNAFGLYDMHGNLWEWCLDEYFFNYKGAPTDGGPRQNKERTPRVLRGGGWDYHAKNCRSAVRCGYSAWRRYTFHGLRLVWLPDEKYSDRWFSTWEAERIGDNMVSYQSDIGAWPKNMRMEAHGYQGEKFTKNWGTTIDNSATFSQMRFLAKLYRAGGKKRFKDSFLRGLDFLLKSQYKNGGFPQRFPRAGDYGDYITFNDDAMTGVLTMMSEALAQKDSDLLSPQMRKVVQDSYDRGVQCILDCQVRVKGKRTVWGQQHDPLTLLPRTARSYEPIGFTGRESAGVVEFLMDIENPSPQIVKSIEAAVAWYKENKITGIRFERIGGNLVIVKDPSAPALWARFYEIETGRPIFAGHDGVVKYSLAEIEKDRRTGYSWYCQSGQQVFEAYAKWKQWRKKLQK